MKFIKELASACRKMVPLLEFARTGIGIEVLDDEHI